MRRIGLIGCGAIGAAIVEMWPQHLGSRESLVAVLVRPGQIPVASTRVDRRTLVTADVAAFANCTPDVVIEAAGHAAVAEYGATLLEKRLSRTHAFNRRFGG